MALADLAIQLYCTVLNINQNIAKHNEKTVKKRYRKAKTFSKLPNKKYELSRKQNHLSVTNRSKILEHKVEADKAVSANPILVCRIGQPISVASISALCAQDGPVELVCRLEMQLKCPSASPEFFNTTSFDVCYVFSTSIFFVAVFHAVKDCNRH